MELETSLEQSVNIKRPELQGAVGASTHTRPAKAYGARREVEKGVDREALGEFMNAVEKFTGSLGVSVRLNYHEASRTIQAEVRDASGEKVLREIPSDDLLKLAVSVRKLSGLLGERSL